MSSPNVQKLVEYIKRNPDLSSSILEKSVIKAGYLKEELNQALDISALSKTAGNPGQMNKHLHKTGLFVFAVIAFIFISGGIAYYYFIKQNRTELGVAKPLSTSSTNTASNTANNNAYMNTSTFKKLIKPTGETQYNPPLPTASEADPLKSFLTAISSGNYKVTTAGKIESAKQEDAGVQTSTLKETSSLDLNHLTFYIQKGSVVRSDSTDRAKPEIVIFKGDKVYALSPDKKTYTVLSATDTFGQFYISVIPNSFPVLSLAEDTQKGFVAWQKADNNQWQADWKWKTPFDPVGITVKVKILQDSATGLVTMMSMRFEDAIPWQEVTFRYEKIENIESLLVVPSDYKEETPEFPSPVKEME